MNIKKHYKIIISIIIVIILLSSLIVYFNLPKTEYYNDVNNFELKYYKCNTPEKNITASSYSVTGNKVSYLNSTMSSCIGWTGYGHELCISIEVSKNYKGKITIESNPAAHFIKKKGNCYVEAGYPVVQSIYFNFTVKVTSGNLYNVFHIVTVRESAIYGCIVCKSNGSTDKVNTQIYIENMNNSQINTINIVNGRYYYFVNPLTEYRIYSFKNNTMNLITTVSNTAIKSYGESHPYYIFGDDL